MRAVWIAVLLAGCFVHRRTDDLTCSASDPTCPEGRVCENGFCLPIAIDAAPDAPECPFVAANRRCTTCDLNAQTCEVDCSTPNSCINLNCPSGFQCTFDCSKNGACTNIDCQMASSCNITCSAVGACSSIMCGTSACQVNCSANNACLGTISCDQSCACDVNCVNGGCSATCPSGCTGAGNMKCSSTAMASCNTCP